jgi:tRNA dimethylallyltransferase
MNNKKVIVIAGPTASGKTAVAIDVAKELGTEILSADSRQCYRELDIGVARPSKEELEAVPHHFIASHSIHDDLNAAAYEQYALGIAGKIFETQDNLVMIGGTGLYIQAFCEGMDAIPEVPTEIREELFAEYAQRGLHWLQQEIEEHDPQFYKSGEIKNPQRLLRALEVVRATGKSILVFRKGKPAKRPFEIVKIALELPREELYERINQRVLQMMEAGLENEAQELHEFRELNALQTVGYRELFDFFDNRLTLEEAVKAIQTHTRHYAKRQITWFKKDTGFVWMKPDEVVDFVKKANEV